MATVRFEELSRWNVAGEDCDEPWLEVRGKFHISIDPNHPLNERVRGIRYFPPHEPIQCEADAMFIIPSSQEDVNCVVLDVPNRGLPLSWFICNKAPFGRLDKAFPVGDGFTRRSGMAFAVCGWQSCLTSRPGMYSLRAPTARNDDGTPLSGMTMCEFDTSSCHMQFPGLPDPDRRILSLSSRGHVSMTAAGTTQPDARLFVLDSSSDPYPQEIARSKWKFGIYAPDGSYSANNGNICMEQGFEKGKLYHLYYKTDHAIVSGLQQVVFREFASWVKYEGGVYGAPPLRSSPVIAIGGSQSGRFLRSWIADDFLIDQHGRNVVDGVSVWVAGASRGQFNQVFGQASLALPHLATDRLPFAPVAANDCDQPSGLHDKLKARDSVTKIIYTNTSIEYHRGDASLLHVSPDAKEDLDIDEANTRVYLLAGCPHNPTAAWPPSFADGMPPGEHIQQNLTIGHSFAPLYRKQILLLLEWTRDGVPPPPSCHPRLSDGTLVTHGTAYQFFDSVPSAHPPGQSERTAGLGEEAASSYARLRRMDYGLNEDGLCTKLPPVIGSVYEGSLVPAVNEDGIDLGALYVPSVAVPLCSYVGWALRHPDFGGERNIMMVSGATIPFSKSKEERESSGDPRIAALERYSCRDEFVCQTLEAADALARARFICKEDVESYRSVAERTWEWFFALPRLS